MQVAPGRQILLGPGQDLNDAEMKAARRASPNHRQSPSHREGEVMLNAASSWPYFWHVAITVTVLTLMILVTWRGPQVTPLLRGRNRHFTKKAVFCIVWYIVTAGVPTLLILNIPAALSGFTSLLRDDVSSFVFVVSVCGSIYHAAYL